MSGVLNIVSSYKGAAPAGSLLLDTYTGAVGVFSLRQLRSAQTNCVTVRRASDNTEQTIGFSSNGIDASALTTFASGTNADVKTWFNQVGSNDISQSNAGQQPRIVTSGNIENDGSDYGIKFIRTDSDVLTGNIISTSKIYTIFAVVKLAASENNYVLHLNGTATGYGMYTSGGTWKVFSRGIGENGAGSYSTNTVLLTVCRKSDSDLTMRINGSQVYSGSASAMNTPSGTFYLGGGDFGDYFGGHIMEWICYDSDQSSNITAIENDIANFYTNI